VSGFSELPGKELHFENMLEHGGKRFALSSTRKPVWNDKTANEDFFLPTLLPPARN